MLLLLGALAVVCTWTHDSRVIKGYLISVAFADWGHIYAAYQGIEAAQTGAFWAWRDWNDSMRPLVPWSPICRQDMEGADKCLTS